MLLSVSLNLAALTFSARYRQSASWQVVDAARVHSWKGPSGLRSTSVRMKRFPWNLENSFCTSYDGVPYTLHRTAVSLRAPSDSYSLRRHRWAVHEQHGLSKSSAMMAC